jgi:hypothetical protein
VCHKGAAKLGFGRRVDGPALLAIIISKVYQNLIRLPRPPSIRMVLWPHHDFGWLPPRYSWNRATRRYPSRSYNGKPAGVA